MFAVLRLVMRRFRDGWKTSPAHLMRVSTTVVTLTNMILSKNCSLFRCYFVDGWCWQDSAFSQAWRLHLEYMNNWWILRQEIRLPRIDIGVADHHFWPSHLACTRAHAVGLWTPPVFGCHSYSDKTQRVTMMVRLAFCYWELFEQYEKLTRIPEVDQLKPMNKQIYRQTTVLPMWTGSWTIDLLRSLYSSCPCS